jgi:SAM-dependent methyltransferase
MSAGAGFKDHFSGNAAQYARFRPEYPAGFLAALAAAAPARTLAWDCATGNGQAAVGLAPYFERVLATDASAAQLSNAMPRANITYRIGVEDDSGLPPAVADLVTVAQAIHWFDIARFHREVRRVARPGAVVAAWTYRLAEVDSGVDAVVRWLHRERVAPYWPPERALVDDGYRSIDWPYEPIDVGAWRAGMRMDRDTLVGYLGTWSAVNRARQAGDDPLPELRARLRAAWPDGEECRHVGWPLVIRAGRVPG